MITCTRRIQFCAGHRVLRHESKCAHVHGHNYVIHVTAIGIDQELDGIGRVVDFSVLKERIGGWIDHHWDHGFLAYSEDHDVIDAIEKLGHKLYVMPHNPTAENIGRELLRIAPELLEDVGVRLMRVLVQETENCSAEVTP